MHQGLNFYPNRSGLSGKYFICPVILSRLIYKIRNQPVDRVAWQRRELNSPEAEGLVEHQMFFKTVKEQRKARKKKTLMTFQHVLLLVIYKKIKTTTLCYVSCISGGANTFFHSG